MFNPKEPHTKFSTFLDIETDGTSAGCNVWEIGVVVTYNDLPVGQFESLIRPQGGVADPETLDWLDDKGLLVAYQRAQHEGRTLAQCCAAINRLYVQTVDLYGNVSDDYTIANDREHHTVFTWGNFDIGILEAACKLPTSRGATALPDTPPLKLPWHYGAGCSLRDVHKYHGLPKDFRPDTSAHRALEDANALHCFKDKMDFRVSGLIITGAEKE